MSDGHKRIHELLPEGARHRGLTYSLRHDAYFSTPHFTRVVGDDHAHDLIEHAAMVYLMGQGWAINGTHLMRPEHTSGTAGVSTWRSIGDFDTLADALLAGLEWIIEQEQA